MKRSAEMCSPDISTSVLAHVHTCTYTLIDADRGYGFSYNGFLYINLNSVHSVDIHNQQVAGFVEIWTTTSSKMNSQ